MSNEEFEKELSSYAAEHVTGSVGLVRKIASHFYDALKPEIDALETENRRLSDSLEAIDLDTKTLVDEIAVLKAEVERLREAAEKFLEYLDTAEPVFPEQFEAVITNLRAELAKK